MKRKEGVSRTRRAGALAVALLLAAAAPRGAAAQPPPPGDGERDGGRAPGELLEAVRFWRMAEVMQLDEEQTVRSLKKAKSFHEAERLHRQARRRNLDELRGLLDKPEPDRGAVESKVNELERSDRAFFEERLRLRAELLEGLSTEQRARYYLFEEQFPREMRRLKQRAGGRERFEERLPEDGPPRPGLPGPPGSRRPRGGRG